MLSRVRRSPPRRALSEGIPGDIVSVYAEARLNFWGIRALLFYAIGRIVPAPHREEKRKRD